MTPSSAWQRAVQPLRSRKVRVALATVLAAFAAQYGLNVSDELIATILGVGVALIWGIAHEDAAAKSKPNCRCGGWMTALAGRQRDSERLRD